MLADWLAGGLASHGQVGDDGAVVRAEPNAKA